MVNYADIQRRAQRNGQAATVVPCCPVRAYAAPAPSVDCVYVPEIQTRTAIVLGIKVEIPLQGPPKRTFR